MLGVVGRLQRNLLLTKSLDEASGVRLRTGEGFLNFWKCTRGSCIDEQDELIYVS